MECIHNTQKKESKTVWGERQMHRNIDASHSETVEMKLVKLMVHNNMKVRCDCAIMIIIIIITEKSACQSQ